MTNTQLISVDIVEKFQTPPPRIIAKQNDSNCRVVKATIMENGIVQSDLSEIAKIVFGGIKGNPTYCLSGTIVNGTITFTIPQAALKQFGIQPCEIQISGSNGENLATMNFEIDIIKSAMSENIAEGLPDNVDIIERILELQSEMDDKPNSEEVQEDLETKLDKDQSEGIGSGNFLIVGTDGFVQGASVGQGLKIEFNEYSNEMNVNLGNTLKTTENNELEVETEVIATKEYVNSQFSGAIKRYIVAELPTEEIDENGIYMLPKSSSTENNIYDEYMYINSAWEMIGSTSVDLSDYYTKAESDNNFATHTEVTSAEENMQDYANGVVSEHNESEVAHADLFNEKASKEYVNENFSNAVVNTAIGTAIAINDISPIEHIIELNGTANDVVTKYDTLNICKPIYSFTNQTKNGIAMTNIADGYGVNISGTASADTLFLTNYLVGQVLKAGKYYVNEHIGYSIRFNFTNSSNVPSQKQLDNNSRYLTIAEDLTLRQIGIIVLKNTVLDKIYNPQLSVVMPNCYEPYAEPTTITLDENGKSSIDSMQNMTLFADNELSVNYNQDLIKVINTLKNAIVTLGGAI